MRIIHCAWAAALLSALAAGSCAKDTTGNGGTGTTESYNDKIDSYLAERYLWNSEYGQMTRDLTIEYAADNDNFLTRTLLGMTSNTLDKKRYTNGTGQNYYKLYSYITRKARSRAATGPKTRGVNHGVRKETEYGFGFARLGVVRFSNTGKAGFYVMAVYPGSPADRAGFRRGTIFSEIDGAEIADSESEYTPVYKRLTSPSGAASVLFKVRETGEETTLTAERLYPNPVLRAEVIEEGEHKIGGGHVSSAKMLATCIAGEKCDGKVFQYYRYNDSRMADPAKTQKQTGNTYDREKALFYENFSYGDYYGADLKQYALGLQNIYVLTTGSTASSSEAVINGLRGIDIGVTLIGEKTNGKNVGMEIDKFDDGDYSYELAPITFEGYNAKKETVNPAGLAVNYAVADWNNRLVDFGPEEPMLAKALSLITGRTYTPAPGRSAAGIAPIAGVSLPEDARRPAGMLVLSPQHGE